MNRKTLAGAFLGFGVVGAAVLGSRDRSPGVGSFFVPGESPEAVALGTGAVVLRGLSNDGLDALHALAQSERSDLVRLYSSEADLSDPSFPSVQGSVEIEGAEVLFVPRYPFVAGDAYRLVVTERDGGQRVFDVMFSADPGRVAAQVESVYPSASVLPANQLKLYVHFSRPMRLWDPYEHISLVDAETGADVPDVFHAMRDGLWDAAGTRFTIVFDPGRIKRGLANNLELGMPLEAGHTYRLVIADTWLDEEGVLISQGHAKEFTVANADRTQPDPATWAISAPRAGTTDALVVRFPEPMDHALLERMLSVSLGERSIAGTATPGGAEREWRFEPHDAWRQGSYAIRVDTRLEDLAGNSIERLFDVDLDMQTGVPHEGERDDLVLPFVVGRMDVTNAAPGGSDR